MICVQVRAAARLLQALQDPLHDRIRVQPRVRGGRQQHERHARRDILVLMVHRIRRGVVLAHRRLLPGELTSKDCTLWF